MTPWKQTRYTFVESVLVKYIQGDKVLQGQPTDAGIKKKCPLKL
jgi:hypothetical protein